MIVRHVRLGTFVPSGADIRVSIPQRSHDMLAGILLDAAVSEARGENARQAAQRLARERGQQTGAAERDRVKPGRLLHELSDPA